MNAISIGYTEVSDSSQRTMPTSYLVRAFAIKVSEKSLGVGGGVPNSKRKEKEFGTKSFTRI